MVGILAHREVLAFAYDIPDVAEHEQIARNGARQARDIVGVAGDEPGRKTLCKMRRRVFFRHGVIHPSRKVFAYRDVLLPGEIDKAAGKIGIAGGERRLDILFDDGLVVSQGRIELAIRKFRRIVLRQQYGAGVARMRPQRGEQSRANPHASDRRTDPHPQNPDASSLLKTVCRFYYTTSPRTEGALC